MIMKGVGMFQWKSIGGYLDCLERNHTATNVALLVPQGNLRLLACGPCEKTATKKEIVDQVKLLREAMDDGAIGMSSGLTYTPGKCASDDKLAVLCGVLAKEYPRAYYAPHLRSYGHRAMESYEEMIDLGKKTGCPIHLTHAHLGFPDNKGRAPELLSMVDRARSEGNHVTLNTYRYCPANSTRVAQLPSWANSGEPSETLKRLDDPETREKIRVAVVETGCDGGFGIPTN